MRTVLGEIASKRQLPSSSSVVDWTVGVGACLLKHGVTAAECEAMLAAIYGGHWREIRVLKMHSTLFAKIEHGMLESGRAWKLNDHADIYRLCVSLVHADIVTCDGPMRHIIRQTKLETSLPVTIFSITEPEKLVEHIEGLV